MCRSGVRAFLVRTTIYRFVWFKIRCNQLFWLLNGPELEIAPYDFCSFARAGNTGTKSQIEIEPDKKRGKFFLPLF